MGPFRTLHRPQCIIVYAWLQLHFFQFDREKKRQTLRTISKTEHGISSNSYSPLYIRSDYRDKILLIYNMKFIYIFLHL